MQTNSYFHVRSDSITSIRQFGVMGPNAAELMSQHADRRKLNHATRIETVYSRLRCTPLEMMIAGILALNDRG